MERAGVIKFYSPSSVKVTFPIDSWVRINRTSVDNRAILMVLSQGVSRDECSQMESLVRIYSIPICITCSHIEILLFKIYHVKHLGHSIYVFVIHNLVKLLRQDFFFAFGLTRFHGRHNTLFLDLYYFSFQ